MRSILYSKKSKKCVVRTYSDPFSRLGISHARTRDGSDVATVRGSGGAAVRKGTRCNPLSSPCRIYLRDYIRHYILHEYCDVRDLSLNESGER